MTNLRVVAPDGFLTLENGHALTVSGALSNAGVIALGTGSVLTVGGGYTQTGHTALSGGGLVVAGLVDLQAGVLTGFGGIVGNVRNNALLEVGGAGAAGLLSITGDFTQTADGALSLDLGDFDSGNYDRLEVGGTAALDGALLVTLLEDFTAREDDAYTLLTAAAVTGKFTALDLPDLGKEYELEARPDEFSYMLAVVRRA